MESKRARQDQEKYNRSSLHLHICTCILYTVMVKDFWWSVALSCSILFIIETWKF